MLHLRCGDDILAGLAEANLPGSFAKWGDPLCEGPLRAWPDDAARRAERAAWLAARYGEREADTLAELERADVTLARAGREDEVVLWFEDDLFDQAILVFLLDRLADLAPDRTSLICIGAFPGVHEFVGLGQLTTAQLASLFPTRIRVTPAQFALAREAWTAWTSESPLPVFELAATETPELPFLAGALRRWLAELPSVRNGLGETEWHGLQAIAAGADTLRHAFPAVQRFEHRPWQGDAMFYATLRLLAEGPRPLLVPAAASRLRAGDPALATAQVELTDDGRAVLAGREDWLRLSRAVRWQGGILIEGPEPEWRWDDRAGRPVRNR